MSILEERPGLPTGNSTARRASHPGRKEQLAELLVFLLLTVPSMALSFLFVSHPAPQMGFVLAAVMTMLRDVSLVALISYFLWRNGEPFLWRNGGPISRIGWRMDNVWRDVLLGVVLFVPFFFFNVGIERLFLQVGLSKAPPGAEAFLQPQGPGQLVLATVLVAVVAITEETIFRGYLLLRLSAVSRSVILAVIFSSLIFAIGHAYEGTAGAATVGVMGTIFALIYLWRGSLVAPITMHFLQDFLAIVILSVLVSN